MWNSVGAVHRPVKEKEESLEVLITLKKQMINVKTLTNEMIILCILHRKEDQKQFLFQEEEKNKDPQINTANTTGNSKFPNN